jgi:Tol biopolymer transport system component
VIYTSKQEHGKWSAATPAEFSGNHSESGPFVSPDGRWLYFVSERPTSDDDELNDDTFEHVVRRLACLG